MATGIPQDEMRSFHEFLGRRLENDGTEITPEESVREFRIYQEEWRRFIADTQPALEQSRQGESKPLDIDALMDRVRARLAEQGITD